MGDQASFESPVQKCPESGCEFQSHYAYSLLCHKIIHETLKVVSPELVSVLGTSNFGTLQQDPVDFKLPEEIECLRLHANRCIDGSKPSKDSQSHSEIHPKYSVLSTNLPKVPSLISKMADSSPKKRGRKPKQVNSGVVLESEIGRGRHIGIQSFSDMRDTNSSLLFHLKSNVSSPAKKRGRKRKVRDSFSEGERDLDSIKHNSTVPNNEIRSFEKKLSPKRLVQSTSPEEDSSNVGYSSGTDNMEMMNGGSEDIALQYYNVKEKLTGKNLTRSLSENSGSSKTLLLKRKHPRMKRQFTAIKRLTPPNCYSRRKSPESLEKVSNHTPEVLSQPFNSFDLTKLNANDITNKSRIAQHQYVCILCKKFMRFRHHFIYHAISHTGERPFICKFCGKSYTQHHNLTVHLSKSHGTEVSRASKSEAEQK